MFLCVLPLYLLLIRCWVCDNIFNTKLDQWYSYSPLFSASVMKSCRVHINLTYCPKYIFLLSNVTVIVAVCSLRTCYVEITDHTLTLLKCLIEMGWELFFKPWLINKKRGPKRQSKLFKFTQLLNDRKRIQNQVCWKSLYHLFSNVWHLPALWIILKRVFHLQKNLILWMGVQAAGSASNNNFMLYETHYSGLRYVVQRDQESEI